MWRGRASTSIQGLPDGAEEAPVHGWDYDCEGFGNSRLKQRNGLIPTTPFGTIDIGADQCGGLIMAGYIPSTRMFAANVEPYFVQSAPRIFFVGAPNQANLPRPLCNHVVGLDLWVSNAQASTTSEPFPYQGMPWTHYVSPDPGTARWLLYTNGLIGAAPRNLSCDFSPALMSDPKLWNGPLSLIGPLPEKYSCNPYYHAFWPSALLPPPLQWYLDNPTVFHNRFHALPHQMNTWAQPIGTGYNFQLARTWVLDSHLNPPSTLYDPVQDANWLFGTSGFFGPWSVCGGPAFNTSQWCLNDMCPDELPPIALALGIRINCEIPRSLSPVGANTNLQTFLVIPNGGLGPAVAMSAGPTLMSQASATSLSSGLSIAVLLNIPAYLGTEVDFRTYGLAVRSLTSGGQ
jgi:hypothetical protein